MGQLLLFTGCMHLAMFCVNTWLMRVLISCVFMSCFVWATGWWFCLLAMCLSRLVWAHGLSCVSLSHVDCQTPPFLLPDYWFICPTSPNSLLALFAPYLSPCVCSPVPDWRCMYIPCSLCVVFPSSQVCLVSPLGVVYVCIWFYFIIIKSPSTLHLWWK